MMNPATMVPNTSEVPQRRQKDEIHDLFSRSLKPQPWRTSYDTKEICGTIQ